MILRYADPIYPFYFFFFVQKIIRGYSKSTYRSIVVGSVGGRIVLHVVVTGIRKWNNVALGREVF